MHVVISDLESQQATAESLLSKYPADKGSFVPCDVTKKVDLEALAHAASSHGGASVWFNNAGINTEGMKPGEEDLLLVAGGRRWRTQQAINLDAVIEGTQVKVPCDKFILAMSVRLAALPNAFNKEVHMYSVCPTFTDTPL